MLGYPGKGVGVQGFEVSAVRSSVAELRADPLPPNSQGRDGEPALPRYAQDTRPGSSHRPSVRPAPFPCPSLVWLTSNRAPASQHVIRSTEAPPASLFRLLDIFRSFYPESVLPSGVARTGGAGGLGKALEEWRERGRELLKEGEGEMGGLDGREVGFQRRTRRRTLSLTPALQAKRRKTTQAYIPLGATYTSTSVSLLPVSGPMRTRTDIPTSLDDPLVLHSSLRHHLPHLPRISNREARPSKPSWQRVERSTRSRKCGGIEE